MNVYTIWVVAITYDPSKERRNLAKHHISLGRFADMGEQVAVASPRSGEGRYLVFGLIDGILHAAVTVERDADIRVISLRRASRRERKVYDHHGR